jgi:hypothetical protein
MMMMMSAPTWVAMTMDLVVVVVDVLTVGQYFELLSQPILGSGPQSQERRRW